MPEKIQAKGMQHIRNLKNVADALHKEYDNTPGMFIDCLEAALMQHRKKCIEHKKKTLTQTIETHNPS